jgi:hypothetical protein
MSSTSAVTLSNENRPSRSRSYREPRPAASDAQRPACAPRRLHLQDAAHQLGVGRP